MAPLSNTAWLQNQPLLQRLSQYLILMHRMAHTLIESCWICPRRAFYRCLEHRLPPVAVQVEPGHNYEHYSRNDQLWKRIWFSQLLKNGTNSIINSMSVVFLCLSCRLESKWYLSWSKTICYGHIPEPYQWNTGIYRCTTFETWGSSLVASFLALAPWMVDWSSNLLSPDRATGSVNAAVNATELH